MSRDWLGLRFTAPLMSFGSVVIDHIGPTSHWPGLSMMTGLLGNALGWHWIDKSKHQRLQNRLILATAARSAGELLTDTQNARLGKSDQGWTTFGAHEERGGNTYDTPHRRQREYLADADLAVVLALDSPEDEPSVDQLYNALLHPARPLFLGRKPCIPAGPLLDKEHPRIKANTAYEALQTITEQQGLRACWPQNEGPRGTQSREVTDLRNWDTGLYGGSRIVHEGRL